MDLSVKHVLKELTSTAMDILCADPVTTNLRMHSTLKLQLLVTTVHMSAVKDSIHSKSIPLVRML